MIPSFKAVGPAEAELHILKVEKLDACIRPLFANSVTYTVLYKVKTFNSRYYYTDYILIQHNYCVK